MLNEDMELFTLLIVEGDRLVPVFDQAVFQAQQVLWPAFPAFDGSQPLLPWLFVYQELFGSHPRRDDMRPKELCHVRLADIPLTVSCVALLNHTAGPY